MRFLKHSLLLYLFFILGPPVASPLSAAQCGWEWCACKGKLGRHLLASPSGATGSHPKYAPDRKIDVSHVRLDLSPNFENRSLKGKVDLTFAPVAKPIDEVRLDSVDLDIEKVVATVPIESWDTSKSELIIHFEETVEAGTEVTVTVHYEVFPKHGWYFRTEAMGYPPGDDHFFTQGEPERHSHWFPGYDYPNERFTSEVICRVPEGMTVLSNGKLVNETTAGGVSTFHWLQDKEHVNYLISVVGGFFRHLEGTHGDLPLAFYTPPSYFAEAENSFRDTARILPFFEKEIGRAYPWDKYYNVCVADFLAGGMENTSVTTLTTGTLFSSESENLRSSHRLDAHEIAHQWFGNLVTCKDWSHLWLNEGFATYYTHLYEGEKNGEDAMRYGLYRDAQRLLSNSDTKPIVWRGYSDPMEQFDYRAYPKGSWVLHMLRSQLGEELFRECVHTYLERNLNDVVVTSDLAEVFEDKTGQSWDRFFDQWVYHGGTPKIKVSYSWDQGKKLAKVRLEQTQKTGDRVMQFHLDVPIRFIGEDGKSTYVLAELREKARDFAFSLPGKPKIVRIDPDLTLLAAFDFKPANALLFAQLENGDDIIGRILAAKQLGGRKDAASLMRLGSLLAKDPFYGVRIEAVNSLAKSQSLAGLEKLTEGEKQEDARVRKALVEAVAKFYRPEAFQYLKGVLESESNPLIVTEALEGLGKYPNEDVAPLLTKALSRESYQHAVAVSVIRALRIHGDPNHSELVEEHIKQNQSRFRTRDIGRALDTVAFLARNEPVQRKKTVREFLGDYLGDPRESLRPLVIDAFATLEDPAGIPVLSGIVSAGDKDSADYKAAIDAIESLNAEKKQADEVRDLRKEVLDLQREFSELNKKLEALEKQKSTDSEN